MKGEQGHYFIYHWLYWHLPIVCEIESHAAVLLAGIDWLNSERAFMQITQYKSRLQNLIAQRNGYLVLAAALGCDQSYLGH